VKPVRLIVPWFFVALGISAFCAALAYGNLGRLAVPSVVLIFIGFASLVAPVRKSSNANLPQPRNP
jgi:hypothetical protein